MHDNHGWETAPGWAMETPERIWLVRAAEACGPEACIVNIGVALGASVHCLRAGGPAARLVAIDLDNSLFEGDAGAEMITGDSGEVGRGWEGPVHLLFVDGDHTREGVERDLAAWLPHVAAGGVVAFHDYYSWREHTRGVREAVDGWDWSGWQELAAAGSLKAFRKGAAARREFGRLGIGVPTFRMVPEFWLWWTWLVAGGFRAGDVLLNDAEMPMEVPHPVAHNALVRAFLETDCDTLLIIEDDHNADEGVVERMRARAANQEFDVVCASYVNRRGTPWPVGCGTLTGAEGPGGLNTSLDLRRVEESGTQPVDVAALGLVLVRREVLVAMLGDEDPATFEWFRSVGSSSLDMWFYREVKRLGFRAGVDRDEWIGHVGRYIWGRGDYEKALAECKARFLAQADEPGEAR